MDYRNVAVISGGTAGIGESVAQECVKQGIYVILVGRSIQKMKETCLNLGTDNSDFFVLDIGDLSKIEKVVLEIEQKYKRIDILVNCAGIAEFGSIFDMRIDRVQKAINVNLLGTMFLSKEIAKGMANRRSGQIIIIDSIAGIKGFEFGSSYVVSKFGLVGFAQVLWEELKKYEVKVCSIRPGLVSTEFYSSLNTSRDTALGLAVEDISYLVMNVINQSERSNISEIVIRPLKRNAQTLFFDILKENYEESSETSYKI